VRWQRLREDPLPHPFMFTTDIAHEDDYQRELRKIADRLRATPDPALDAALEDIARPDIAILVRGSDGFDPANPEASIRLLAARRDSRGYLLTQLPGRTVDHSAGFTIAECDAIRLAEQVVDALPEAAAGSYPFLSLPTEPDADPHEEYEGEARPWGRGDGPDDARAARV